MMEVRELIRQLLSECGQEKCAEQIYKQLEVNDVGILDVGADVGPGAVCYVQKINNEGPCFMGLDCEPYEE